MFLARDGRREQDPQAVLRSRPRAQGIIGQHVGRGNQDGGAALGTVQHDARALPHVGEALMGAAHPVMIGVVGRPHDFGDRPQALVVEALAEVFQD